MSWIWRCALTAIVALLAIGAPEARAVSIPAPFFSPSSVWNQVLRPNAPLDAYSALTVTHLQQQLLVKTPWINTTASSVPVYRVKRDQPRVAVLLRANNARLARSFASVPIPAGANPDGASDHHMVIWQPGRDTMWEFFGAEKVNGRWSARWGARLNHMSKNGGYSVSGEGATATGLALAGGLMTIDELRRNRIDHALAIALPHVTVGRILLPARRTDGKSTAPDAIPSGTRFRLDPTLDLKALHLPRPIGAMARAAQMHGIIVRDTSANVTFYGQTPLTDRDRAVYRSVFAGRRPNQLLAAFPWGRLHVLRPLK